MPKFKYAANSGAIVSIRVSDAIKALDPSTEPAGAVESPFLWAYVSGSRRRNTLRARQVVLTRSETTAGGLRAVKSIRVPCLTEAGANTLFNGGAVTYRGSSYTPSSLIPEG